MGFLTESRGAVAQLYGALAELTGSPVVEINRAVAVAECEGVARGLEILDSVAVDPRLASYQPTGPHVPTCDSSAAPLTPPTRLTPRRSVWSWTPQ